jgi:hypothetical protein
MHRMRVFAVMAAFLACPLAAVAADESDITELRKQIEQMKQEQNEQIKALEKRLEEAEKKAAEAQKKAEPAGPQTEQAKPQAGAATGEANTGQQQRQNASNPAISLILQGRYANLSQNPDDYQIDGFFPTGGEVGPGPRGFSLAESELSISGNVDPYFGGSFTAALTPENEAEVEEAFFYTTALGHGFTIKGGRFLSGIGYLNPMHQHAWDFIDTPLPYQAFLGGQLDDDALQVKWVAPVKLLVEIGGEAGRGRGFPASNDNNNGVGLATLFAHVGGDRGVSNSWRAGLSYVHATPDDLAYEGTDSTGTTVNNSFSGTADLWIADFVWKWAPHGNPKSRNFKFQTEYFWSDNDGTLTFDADGASTGPIPGSYEARQSGWYAQMVYQFIPKWRVGVRYDQLNHGTVNIAQVQSGALPASDFSPLSDNYNPSLWTVMIDWSLSEFSRFRLQYAQSRTQPGVTDDEIFLQYIMALGSHGAHTW